MSHRAFYIIFKDLYDKTLHLGHGKLFNTQLVPLNNAKFTTYS